MRRRGDIAEALSTAASWGPATVRELAARAQVGYAAARYTESRMTARGELVRLSAGRPALVALPDPADDTTTHSSRAGQVAGELLRSFWDVPRATAGG
jgi:predicted transcriptional regulator of viral defense system